MLGFGYYLCGFLFVILLTAFFVVRSNNIKKKEAVDKSRSLSEVAHNLFNVFAEVDGFRTIFKIIIDSTSRMVIIMYSPTHYKKIPFLEILDIEIYEDGMPLPLVSRGKTNVSSVYIILKTFSSSERLLFYDAWEATGLIKKSIHRGDSAYQDEYLKGVKSATTLMNLIKVIIDDKLNELPKDKYNFRFWVC